MDATALTGYKKGFDTGGGATDWGHEYMLHQGGATQYAAVCMYLLVTHETKYMYAYSI